MELDAHLRMAAAEFRQQQGQPVVAPGGADPQMEYCFHAAQNAQFIAEVGFCQLDFLHLFDVERPGPGDLDGSDTAVKQFYPELFLQTVDVVGQGGLGDKGFAGSPGEVAFLCQGQDIIQFIQAHRKSLRRI